MDRFDDERDAVEHDRGSDDDREAIDSAFAEMVAGYHLTSDRPDPLPPLSERSRGQRRTDSSTAWADQHPLFEEKELFEYDEPEAAPYERRDPMDEERERYVPESLPPMKVPSSVALAGIVGIAFAVGVVCAELLGARLPTWVGWLALVSFTSGLAVLISRLPRHRDPDDGNGAVL